MLYPSINLLREKVDSKYTLVTLASKRARDLIDDKPPLEETKINKPVSVATREISDDLITYKRIEELDENDDFESDISIETVESDDSDGVNEVD